MPTEIRDASAAYASGTSHGDASPLNGAATVRDVFVKVPTWLGLSLLIFTIGAFSAERRAELTLDRKARAP